MFTNFLTHSQLITGLARTAIIFSLGFQAAFSADKPPVEDESAPSKRMPVKSFKDIYNGASAGIKKNGINYSDEVPPSPTDIFIAPSIGGLTLSSAASLSSMVPVKTSGGLTLSSAASLSSMVPVVGKTRLVVGTAEMTKGWSGLNGNYPPAVLNTPLIIKTPLTPVAGLTSTVLNPGGVIRINTPALTAAQVTAIPKSESSGFTAAFGIPTPIWGPGSGTEGPWIIIAPTLAPTYALRKSVIDYSLIDAQDMAFDALKIISFGTSVFGGSGLSAFGGSSAGSAALVGAMKAYTDSASAIFKKVGDLPLGWADRLVETWWDGGDDDVDSNQYNINSAIVMDPPALAALVAATAKSTSPTPAAALGIDDTQPTAGRWNIGVTSCGLPGFSVPGAHLQALLAATNGGRLVIAGSSTNGVTIS